MRMLALAIVLFFASSGARAASSFVESGSPKYEALKSLAEQMGSRGWVIDRLHKQLSREYPGMLTVQRTLVQP